MQKLAKIWICAYQLIWNFWCQVSHDFELDMCAPIYVETSIWTLEGKTKKFCDLCFLMHLRLDWEMRVENLWEICFGQKISPSYSELY